MSLPIMFAHGASGSVGVAGFQSTATVTPTTYFTLSVQSWDATLESDEHDTSNTSLVGNKSAQLGKSVLNFNIDAQLKLNSTATGYDQTVNPLGAVSGPNLQADYCSVILNGGLTRNTAATTTVTTGNTTELFRSDVSIIKSFQITNKNDDVISYKITGRSAGAVILNGAS